MNFKIAQTVLGSNWDWQEEVSKLLVKDKNLLAKKRQNIKCGRKRQLLKI